MKRFFAVLMIIVGFIPVILLMACLLMLLLDTPVPVELSDNNLLPFGIAFMLSFILITWGMQLLTQKN